MPSNQLAILFMLSIDISSKWIPTHCLFLDPLTDKLVEASEPLSSNSSSCSMMWSVSRSVLSGSYVGLLWGEVQVGAWVGFFGLLYLSTPCPSRPPLPLLTQLPLSTTLPFPPAMLLSFPSGDTLMSLWSWQFRWMNVVYVWKIYVPIKVQQCIAKHLRIFER